MMFASVKWCYGEKEDTYVVSRLLAGCVWADKLTQSHNNDLYMRLCTLR